MTTKDIVSEIDYRDGQLWLTLDLWGSRVVISVPLPASVVREIARDNREGEAMTASPGGEE